MKDIVFFHEHRIIELNVDIEFMNRNKTPKILNLNSVMIHEEKGRIVTAPKSDTTEIYESLAVLPDGFYFQLNDKLLNKELKKSDNTLKCDNCRHKINRPSVKCSEKKKLVPHLAKKQQVANSESPKIANNALTVKPPAIINDYSKPKKPRRATDVINSKNRTVVHDLEELRNFLASQPDIKN